MAGRRPKVPINLTLRQFDPTTMKDERTCLVIGKRNTGKSVLTKDIMYHKRYLPGGIVMSGTEDGNHWYSSWVPGMFVYNEFDREAVERLVRRQRKRAEKTPQGERMPLSKRAFLLLDDCTYDKKVMRDKNLRQVFMNGRHWGLFVMSTCQYVADVGPDIRNNTDYVFVLRENIKANRERLYKMFFGMFGSQAEFDAAMDVCTENYGALVLDNTNQSNRLEDQVFWYKAKVRNNFRVGAPQMWHYHSKYYKKRRERAVTGQQAMVSVRKAKKTEGRKKDTRKK